MGALSLILQPPAHPPRPRCHAPSRGCRSCCPALRGASRAATLELARPRAERHPWAAPLHAARAKRAVEVQSIVQRVQLVDVCVTFHVDLVVTHSAAAQAERRRRRGQGRPRPRYCKGGRSSARAGSPVPPLAIASCGRRAARPRVRLSDVREHRLVKDARRPLERSRPHRRTGSGSAAAGQPRRAAVRCSCCGAPRWRFLPPAGSKPWRSCSFASCYSCRCR